VSRYSVSAASSRITLPAPPARAEPGRGEHGAGEEQAEASACGAPQLPHATHQFVAQTRLGTSGSHRSPQGRAEAVVGSQELERPACLGRRVHRRDRAREVGRRRATRRRCAPWDQEIPRRVFASGEVVIGWGRAQGSFGGVVGRRWQRGRGAARAIFVPPWRHRAAGAGLAAAGMALQSHDAGSPVTGRPQDPGAGIRRSCTPPGPDRTGRSSRRRGPRRRGPIRTYRRTLSRSCCTTLPPCIR
jgi:hypothetical protein